MQELCNFSPSLIEASSSPTVSKTKKKKIDMSRACIQDAFPFQHQLQSVEAFFLEKESQLPLLKKKKELQSVKTKQTHHKHKSNTVVI